MTLTTVGHVLLWIAAVLAIIGSAVFVAIGIAAVVYRKREGHWPGGEWR